MRLPDALRDLEEPTFRDRPVVLLAIAIAAAIAAVLGAILLIPTAYLAALAVGIVRARPWAWILGFVAGGLVGLYGVLALVIPGNLAANADRWHLAESVPPIAVGAFTLWYFNRRAVRRDLGLGDPALG